MRISDQTIDDLIDSVSGPVKLFCTGCKTSKEEALFSKHSSRTTGRGNWCKVCTTALQARPEYRVRRMAKRRGNPQHTMWIEIRARARKKGLAFDLEETDFVIPMFCPVLGVKLTLDGARSDQTATVDRIDPGLGYIRGNIRVISWLANRLKSNCVDPEIFEAIARYLRHG